MSRQSFLADLDSLHAMLVFIRSFLLNLGFPEELQEKVILAAEEAIINIIQHGYLSEPGPLTILCEECVGQRKGIKIVLEDEGVPFNPIEKTHYAPPHLIETLSDPKTAEMIPTGGYGINLYTQIMDSVEYVPLPKGNRLILIKYYPLSSE